MDSVEHLGECKCCNSIVEHSSRGIYWRLCISCFDAVERFIDTRRANFKRRGLIKK